MRSQSRRIGLGKGRGSGYHNILGGNAGFDHHIHQLAGHHVRSYYSPLYAKSMRLYAKPKFDIDLEKVKDMLPHGSGIDADWHIELKGNIIRASNSFHAMDENGFYDGWQDFELIMPKYNPEQFRLHFTGDRHLANKYGLRDYLEDMFAESVSQMLENGTLKFIPKHYLHAKAHLKYDFYSDPGHGWLKVPISELKELGIADKISKYSHVRDGYAYLEEDVDATLFIHAKEKLEGKAPAFREHIADKYSKIRNYDSFPSAPKSDAKQRAILNEALGEKLDAKTSSFDYKTFQGGLVFSKILPNGQLFTMQYQGYSRRAAERMFNRDYKAAQGKKLDASGSLPGGKKSEQQRQDEFVALMHGRANADRLERIYRESYPRPKAGWGEQYTQREVFEQEAKRQGFTKRQIDAFLAL